MTFYFPILQTLQSRWRGNSPRRKEWDLACFLIVIWCPEVSPVSKLRTQAQKLDLGIFFSRSFKNLNFSCWVITMELLILFADKRTSRAATVIIASVSCTGYGEPNFVFWRWCIISIISNWIYGYNLEPCVDAGLVHMNRYIKYTHETKLIRRSGQCTCSWNSPDKSRSLHVAINRNALTNRSGSRFASSASLT